MSGSRRHVAIAASGAYAGVMLVIGVGLGGRWLTEPATTFASEFEALFPFLVPSIGLTLMPGLIASWLCFKGAASGTLSRRRWRTALLLLGASVAVTVVYHVPANFRIWSGELDESALASELNWWLVMHALRLAAAVAAVVWMDTGTGASDER